MDRGACWAAVHGDRRKVGQDLVTKQQSSQEEVFALLLCQQSESGRVFLQLYSEV